MSRGHGTCREVEWRSSIFILSFLIDSPPHVRLVRLSHLYLKLALLFSKKVE